MHENTDWAQSIKIIEKALELATSVQDSRLCSILNFKQEKITIFQAKKKLQAPTIKQVMKKNIRGRLCVEKFCMCEHSEHKCTFTNYAKATNS